MAGDPAGQEALYEAFAPGLRLFLAHHLQRAEEVEDRLHDVFVQAVAAIQQGQLRESGRLPGFMRTIARRQIAAFIQEVVAQRETSGDSVEGLVVASLAPSPEALAIRRQGREQALEVLGSFSQSDREILIRFYLRGEEPEEICRELGLTANQFRLRKSRAKRRFVRAMGQETKKDRWLSEFPMRKKPASAH